MTPRPQRITLGCGRNRAGDLLPFFIRSATLPRFGFPLGHAEYPAAQRVQAVGRAPDVELLRESKEVLQLTQVLLETGERVRFQLPSGHFIDLYAEEVEVGKGMGYLCP